MIINQNTSCMSLIKFLMHIGVIRLSTSPEIYRPTAFTESIKPISNDQNDDSHKEAEKKVYFGTYIDYVFYQRNDDDKEPEIDTKTNTEKDTCISTTKERDKDNFFSNMHNEIRVLKIFKFENFCQMKEKFETIDGTLRYLESSKIKIFNKSANTKGLTQSELAKLEKDSIITAETFIESCRAILKQEVQKQKDEKKAQNERIAQDEEAFFTPFLDDFQIRLNACKLKTNTLKCEKKE